MVSIWILSRHRCFTRERPPMSLRFEAVFRPNNPKIDLFSTIRASFFSQNLQDKSGESEKCRSRLLICRQKLKQTGTSLVNGAHDTSKLAGLLENFIKKYVQCYGCGNPETEMLITKTQMLQLKCAACGFISDVDMRDKLTSFILKNPPEQKKSSKDKNSMRGAEKERLKEGEAADEELRKRAADELTEQQSRQLHFDLESSYNSFMAALPKAGN